MAENEPPANPAWPEFTEPYGSMENYNLAIAHAKYVKWLSRLSAGHPAHTVLQPADYVNRSAAMAITIAASIPWEDLHLPPTTVGAKLNSITSTLRKLTAQIAELKRLQQVSEEDVATLQTEEAAMRAAINQHNAE